MVVVKGLRAASFSALLLFLAGCQNPFYERVKDVVDTAKAPRIAVAVGSISIGSGGSFDFGPVAVSASSSAVFTITNAGHTDLTLSGGVSLAGANADQFSIPVLPASTVIAGGKSESFTLMFAPTSGGAKSASVTLASNDPGAGSYTFIVTGSGAAAAPAFAPAPGTYSVDQSVSLTSATGGATIYYTTDGSTPTTGSAVYSAAIPVTGNGTTITIKALAAKAGLTDSAVVTGTFAINAGVVSTPNFFPPPGPYTVDQFVTISCATAGAAIYYTTDGTTPTTGSLPYTAPIPVAGNGTSRTIRVLATKAGMTDATASGAYTINYPMAAPPSPAPGPTVYTMPLSVTFTDVTVLGQSIRYTTDGSTPSSTLGTLYTGPIPVPISTTIRAIAYGPAWTDSPVITLPYTLQPLAPVLSPGGGTFSTPTVVTITCSTPGVIIHYTTNGSTPSAGNGTPIPSGGIALISTTGTLRAIASVAGWMDSPVTMGNYTININQPPTFTFPGGRLGNTDSIYMGIVTPGSSIAYTVDGSSPTSDGLGNVTHGTPCPSNSFMPPYGTFVVKAIAYQNGWGDSVVVSQSYHKDLFLYSMEVFGGGVDVFSLDPATGALTHTSTFGLPIPPGGMAIDSIGTKMWVTAGPMNQVWGFTIDPATGALTTNGTPHAAPNPGAINVRKNNDALFVADPIGGNVLGCAIDAGGALTDTGTATAGGPGGAPVALASDASSQFLYAATAASGGSIYGYTLTPAGMPVVMPSSPFPAAGSPTSVTVDPTGAFLYESDHSTGIVRLWNIDSMTGNLTPTFGTPFSLTTNPERMAIDPSGKYLYVTDSVSNSVVMARITAGTGALTTYGIYPTGTTPKGVFVDPSGKFVCVANSGSNSISVFSLDPATGFLTPAGTYSTPLAGPEAILITGTH